MYRVLYNIHVQHILCIRKKKNYNSKRKENCYMFDLYISF